MNDEDVFNFETELAEQARTFYDEDFLYDDSSEGANEVESYDP